MYVIYVRADCRVNRIGHLVTLTISYIDTLKIAFIRHYVDSAYALVSGILSIRQLAATTTARYGGLALPVIPHGKYRVL